MREIKYRGLTEDGEWVKGSLVRISNKHVKGGVQCFIVPAKTGPHEIFHSSKGHYGTETLIRVIPETVGQYIGLKDKNGKEKVYGGDEAIADHPCLIQTHKVMGFVSYDEEEAAWFLEAQSESIRLSALENIEVIGNIHQDSKENK